MFACLKELVLGLTETEFLRIGGCGGLPSLCHNGAGWLARSRCLRNMEILNCSKLVSMGTDMGGQKEELQQMETLCSLEHLRIKHCERLEKLTATMYNLTSLRELEIVKCPKLVSFSHDNLPPTLKRLVVKDCEDLQCLLDEDGININRRSFPSHLIIERCRSLASLSSTDSVHNNTCLEFIFIGRCGKIQCLPDGLDKLSHLHQIHIECSRNLVLISGLPPTGLRLLRLSWCRKLQALPNDFHCLTCLQELEISNCPCLVHFPEKGFPTNLTSLTISKPEILEGLIHWGFHKLTSHRMLTNNGGYSDEVMFHMKGNP
ncbi:hypothetical protein V6N11_004187 [Hibiscus sabdariffa]|uniref:Uncharacterized protein n=1 Tax=Hibiscus sabdariffa TaxID=183260 RepID=A0ABR2SFI3_9ROSI